MKKRILNKVIKRICDDDAGDAYTTPQRREALLYLTRRTLKKLKQFGISVDAAILRTYQACGFDVQTD